MCQFVVAYVRVTKVHQEVFYNVQVQWERYNGKCGLCGDPYPGPRENEPGGKYANGIITRKYQEGQVIEVYVQLTANHKVSRQRCVCVFVCVCACFVHLKLYVICSLEVLYIKNSFMCLLYSGTISVIRW